MVASIPVEAPESRYTQIARDLLQKRLSESPGWLQDVRLKAMSRFETLGFPTRKLEAWKFINLRPALALPLENRTQESKACPPALKPHLLDGDAQVTRLVFINGRFDEALSSRICQENGVVISNLKALLDTNSDLAKPLLDKNLDTENDAFAALNLALFKGGTLVRIPDNVCYAPLVQIIYANFGEESRGTHPRNLVVVGKNAKVNLLIEYIGLTQAACLTNAVNEFTVDEGGEASCTLVLSEGPNSWHLGSTTATLQSKAKLSLDTVTLNGLTNRHSIRTLLQGEQADLRLNGLDVLQQKTEIYHHVVTEHWVPNCTSDQTYKSILDDQSKSEFNSMVFVAKGADGTDSHQLNQTLLLSEDAKVWTRPQLQINADDVKCAHGAAVGQLDEAQLFYLASRGLDQPLAQALLTYGFAEDVIQKIPTPQVRQYLDARVLNNLHRTDATLKQELGKQELGKEQLGA